MTQDLMNGFHAKRGSPLTAGAPVATLDAIKDALKTVADPELMISVYDLGLIYKYDIDAKGDVSIDMTLTAPTCPIAGEMPGMVSDAVAQIPGVGVVNTRLVWDPPWTIDKITEEFKLILGI